MSSSMIRAVCWEVERNLVFARSASSCFYCVWERGEPVTLIQTATGMQQLML
jgi:hypothetical protein